ncbi:prenyltransferase/squalene oxidase repeat-containing protein [Nocardioides sp.]|uniref:prenyltransferase/squalene oxidase repeat-containing protein n=1 Tax=Nocardioides sp. TaxID=35761 RepID=UPI002ED163BA
MPHLPDVRRHLRPVAALAAGALLATSLAAPATAAPHDSSGWWLGRQLNADGLVYNRQFKFIDYGLTADVVYALDILGGHRRDVRRSARGVARNIDSMITGVDFDLPDDVSAGSVAKAMLVAQSAGRNPRRFGGKDLVATLEGLTSAEVPTIGRIADQTTGDNVDFANTLGQAFATVGLADAGSDRAADVRRFLLEQQCARGWFRLTFSAKEAADQSCDADATSVPDTDVTALAVIVLDALPKKGKVVKAAIADAARWLRRNQKDNGSFGGGPSTEASNANSTGLAGWALGEVRSCRATRKAAEWILRLQVKGKVWGTPLARQQGAIAYNRAALRAARSDGITVSTRDQWRRATAQAAPALRFIKGCQR